MTRTMVCHITLQDEQGRDFAVGATVRVAKEGLRAFQIQPKGFGHFDATNTFVPNDDSSQPNGLKSLLLPVGLRGTVTKVYDADDVCANFPIQVKFEPGKGTEEGYDPPAPFLMHFLTDELEAVGP